MKSYGDIPKNYLELIRELEQLEKWFNEHGDTVSSLSAAKGFVCMAHDWYIMDMEEQGDRLIKQADKLYPDYFKEAIHLHAYKDPDFYSLLKGLKNSLGLELMISLGFKDE